MNKLEYQRRKLGLFIPEGVLKSGLSLRSVIVYGRLAHYAYIGDGSSCSPSHVTLASDLNVSKDSVQRGIWELKKKGFIAVRHATGKAILAHKPDTYTLLAHKAIKTGTEQ